MIKLGYLAGGALAATVIALAAVSLASAHAKVTEVEWDTTTNPTKVTATAGAGHMLDLRRPGASSPVGASAPAERAASD
jgi:hypothetical protein